MSTYDSIYYKELPDSFLDKLYFTYGKTKYWSFLAGYHMLYKLDLVPLKEEPRA